MSRLFKWKSRASVGNGLAIVAIAAMIAAPAAAAQPKTVTVKGIGVKLGETPILTRLPDKYTPGSYQLVSEDGSRTPAMIVHDGETCYLAAVLKQVPAEGEQTFSMETTLNDSPPEKGIAFRKAGGKNLDVLIDGKPFTTYRADEPTKPYYYPVFGPTGAEFTRSYPMKTDVAGETKDHPHQRSLWFTHGSVNGWDFWASDPINKPNPKFGAIRETSRKIVAHGPSVGILRTTDDWLGHDGKVVCQDVRDVRFYETTGARVIDFDVTLKATAGPVVFGDTKEGMFGVRVASSMDVAQGKTKGKGKILNAEGVADDAAWGKASPWVDYTGPVEGKTVGIAILNHPKSFRYPTTWHVRPYGLFAANPFGWHDFGLKKEGEYTLPKGEEISFRYRVILHEGDTESARLDDVFKAYSEEPAVSIKSE